MESESGQKIHSTENLKQHDAELNLRMIQMILHMGKESLGFMR